MIKEEYSLGCFSHSKHWNLLVIFVGELDGEGGNIFQQGDPARYPLLIPYCGGTWLEPQQKMAISGIQILHATYIGMGICGGDVGRARGGA